MAYRLRHFATALQRPTVAVASPLLRLRPSTTIRTMASDVPTPAPGNFEWLVVVPDKPGMKAKRLEVRP